MPYFVCHNLYRFVAGCLLLQVFTAHAQPGANGSLNGQVQFGFSLGASTFLPRLEQADIYSAAAGYQDSINGISAVGTPGLMTGFLIGVKLGNAWWMRVNPAILFNHYVVYYNRANGRTDLMTSQNSFLELPLHLLYKRQKKNMKLFAGSGCSYRFDYTRKDNSLSRTGAWSADIGLGLEKKIGQFVFIPEIRYAQALSDVLINRRMEIPALIDRVRLSTVYLVLHISG